LDETTVPANRRVWERIPLAIPMFIRGSDGDGKKFLEFANALNVSAGGMLVATKRYLAPQSRVTLEIPVPDLEKSLPCPAGVRILAATLVRVVHSERFHLSGLKFSRPLVKPLSTSGRRKVSAL
jgi:hypothetical protein